ncbi:endoplasmic reticulum mannosyl-oligosaccharide 1,2-alpha-mannosidase isoform X1 [Ctenocephalides felis]|uniref:endoplasmic reticulum mannosyl-oligosaccharide 1,2-alpha-mannosidase isoform X1 n=1 Tax=Ctenocephalides felis TaxID=7515 RepID=UPI000E6E5AA1|nr:endoplasmic reticulum mannosyl-oligosaccharide 1,2-alpha-mannosidase isoform X1 [Ctenocephalides felis]
MLEQEHVSLNLPDIKESVTHRKSIWRWWNQLSRFQRSLFYMIVLVLFFTLLYLLPSQHNGDGKTIEHIQITPIEANNLPFLQNDQVVSPINLNQNSETNGLDLEKSIKEVRKNVIDEPKHHTEAIYLKSSLGTSHGKVFDGPKTERQKAVVEAFKHAWKGYKTFAWGHDHLKPISETYHDWFGLGLTIVDSLDTMYIMNLKKEFSEARDWVANQLTFEISRDVNLFEITIRVLGGLLSAYHLTNDDLFLQKALDLGERLLPCFETNSGVPFSDVNLATRKAHSPKWSPDSSTSEVTTLQLEFRDLSRSTGDERFENAVNKVSWHIHTLPKTEGLVPIFINANTGQFRSYSTITVGARGDSYYEYLLKQWLQTGKTIQFLIDDYLDGIAGIQKLLVRYTPQNKYLYIGELLSGGKDFKPKMDHLTCYLPGTLALGVKNGMPSTHMKLAEQLLETCYQTYAQQKTFLAPEITYFNIQDEGTDDMYVKTNDAHNLLRPEFIESLWYFYQITGNTTYQDWGWQIFQAFEKHTKVTNGYTSIGNVKQPLNIRPSDMMESFFLSETLKYFYLLFSDNPKLLDLDKYVINSEAHPLPLEY